MTEIVAEYAVLDPAHGKMEDSFLTPEGAKAWLKQHPTPGAIVVGRIHLIGDWTPEEDLIP